MVSTTLLTRPSVYAVTRRALHHLHSSERRAVFPRTCTSTTSFASITGTHPHRSVLLTFTRRHLFRHKIAKLVASSKKSLRSMKKRCAPVSASTVTKKRVALAGGKAKSSKKESPAVKKLTRRTKTNTGHKQTTENKKSKKKEVALQAVPQGRRGVRKTEKKATRNEEIVKPVHTATQVLPSPPRKSSAYITFVAASFHTVAEELKEATRSAAPKDRLRIIGTELSSRWKMLSSDERNVWERRATEAYELKKEAHHQRQDGTANDEVAVRPRRSTKNKKNEESNEPKKVSLYAQFVQACFAEASASVSASESAQKRMSSISRYIGALWKRSTPEERQARIEAYRTGNPVKAATQARDAASPVLQAAPAAAAEAAAEAVSHASLRAHDTVDRFTTAAHSPEAANFTTSTTIIDPHMLSRVSNFTSVTGNSGHEQAEVEATHEKTENKPHAASNPIQETNENGAAVPPTTADATDSSNKNENVASGSTPVVSFFTQTPRSGYW